MDFSAAQIVFRLLNEIHFGSLALPLSLFYFAVFSVAIKDSCRIFSIFVSVFSVLIWYLKRIKEYILSAILCCTGDSTRSILNNQNEKKMSEEMDGWTKRTNKQKEYRHSSQHPQSIITINLRLAFELAIVWNYLRPEMFEASKARSLSGLFIITCQYSRVRNSIKTISIMRAIGGEKFMFIWLKFKNGEKEMWLNLWYLYLFAVFKEQIG